MDSAPTATVWSSLAPKESICIARTSVWSPLLPIVQYRDVDFENEFNPTSVYRGPPSAERAEAWTRLTYKNFVEVSLDKIDLYDRSAHTKSMLKRVPGGDGKGHLALLETFHYLHCLNVIRQYTWFQAGGYHDDVPPEMDNSELANRMHVDHCMETIRMAWMCQADVTPVFVLSNPQSPTGDRADVKAHHRCRNFDEIEAWVDNNHVMVLTRLNDMGFKSIARTFDHIVSERWSQQASR